MSQESLLGPTVGLMALKGLGFESAANSTLISKMRRIQPNGGTALRDSVIQGTSMMLQLYEILAKCEIAHVWNFVHVVLTDGEDTSSKESVSQTCELMRRISQVIPVQALKTWFIGIDLASGGASEIKTLVQSGGENAEFANVSDANIEQIFNQLTLKIGLVHRTQARGAQFGDHYAIRVEQEEVAIMSVEEQHYVVLFNLDMSGSMTSRWNKVCNSVNRFISQMGPGDLVAGLAFNTDVALITQPPPEYYQILQQALTEERNYGDPSWRRQQALTEERSCGDYIKVFFILLFCIICPIFCCFCAGKKVAKYDVAGKACLASILGIAGYIYLFTSMS